MSGEDEADQEILPITAEDDNGVEEQTNVYITGLEDGGQDQNKDGKHDYLLTFVCRGCFQDVLSRRDRELQVYI